MGLFGKSKKEKELERQNALLKQLLVAEASKSKNTSAPKKKQVMYQCRYCNQKYTRDATSGAPGGHCPQHPKGWCKGPHSWMRTFL